MPAVIRPAPGTVGRAISRKAPVTAHNCDTQPGSVLSVRYSTSVATICPHVTFRVRHDRTVVENAWCAMVPGFGRRSDPRCHRTKWTTLRDNFTAVCQVTQRIPFAAASLEFVGGCRELGEDEESASLLSGVVRAEARVVLPVPGAGRRCLAELGCSVHIGLPAVPAAVDPGDRWFAWAFGRRGPVMESHGIADLASTLIRQFG